MKKSLNKYVNEVISIGTTTGMGWREDTVRVMCDE